ncbi:YSIRK-type signal peptide-containing protein, partial [Mammaliicoccus stepanovicii]
MNIFKRGEERQRFSIKKYHFGAASVLIGAIIFASGTQEASANEFKGDLSSTVVGESTSSSEQTEITNNPITIPEAESPTIEVSNPTDKKKDTSKSESSTTEVSNPTDNKEDTLKSESSTTEVSNPTDNKEDTSKSESHTTEVSNPTDNKKDTSKEVREKTDDLSHKSLTLSKNNQKQERNHTPKRRSKRSIVNKEQPPVDGYDVNLEFSPKDDGLSYKINKVTDPKHYTFEVISKGEDGSKQYTISVRKEDLNQEGTLDRFFITTFDNGIRISRREIDKARIRGGEQIKIDDLTLLSVTKKGDEYAFRFQKITDSVGDNYKPVYGPNIEKITSPVVSYPLILPVWKAQTTHYYDEDGNEIAPSYTQYGWTKSKYTTEPPEIKGYDLDYTKIPFNKNGIINKSNAKFEGNIRYGTSTVSRGTIFRKDTVLDNQSTIKTEVWFTYAKRPNTFDPVDGTIRDRGRVASNNLPDANYDFMKNTEGYEIRERLGTAEEEKKYERLGMNGQVVFQKFRFQKNGLPSKDAVSEAEYDGGDATSSTSVVLKKGEVSNSRYDIGRTFDFSNVFEYPDTVEYYYITHKGKVVVHYVDEAGNTIKGTVEDTPNV